MRKINQKTSIFALIIAILAVFSIFIPVKMSYANADTYTYVFNDLQRDSNFDASEYPIISDDHSLQVVSIAESKNKELFIYVYQPSASHRATSISLSIQHKGKDFDLYKLRYINKYKSLYKYVVDNFEVSNDETRYYEISSIFRAFDESIDESSLVDQTISEVSFAVGKQYILTREEIICYDVETIEITNKYVGFVRYWGSGDPVTGLDQEIDSHFVAFSTDKKIEKLLEADIIFKTQKKTLSGASFSADDVEDCECNIDAQNLTATVTSQYLFTKSEWSWDRIQPALEFIVDEDFERKYNLGLFDYEVDYELSEDAIEEIIKCDWVLRFYESAHTQVYSGVSMGIPTIITRWTSVIDVSILRLQFETEGRIYNLGVVDNIQSGSENSSNQSEGRLVPDWLIIFLVVLVVGIILLTIFSPSTMLLILKFIWKCICLLFKGLWWLITLPLEILTKEDKNA